MARTDPAAPASLPVSAPELTERENAATMSDIPRHQHTERGERLAQTDWFPDYGKTHEVRKQYHFWPGQHGLDAWDVDRLVELSHGLNRDEVPLADIGENESGHRITAGSPATWPAGV